MLLNPFPPTMEIVEKEMATRATIEPFDVDFLRIGLIDGPGDQVLRFPAKDSQSRQTKVVFFS